jgi:hypothetical protein
VLVHHDVPQPGVSGDDRSDRRYRRVRASAWNARAAGSPASDRQGFDVPDDLVGVAGEDWLAEQPE